MWHIPPGTGGFCVGSGVFFIIRYLVHRRTPAGRFTFEPRGVAGSFEPRLANYVRAVEYLLGVATGSIVLLVGSSAIHASGRLPWAFASPLIIIGFCVVYGVIFMALLNFYYEEFLQQDNYSRTRYVSIVALGFSTLGCFCLGYLWLVCAVSLTLAR
jgi:hypothetical protein